MIIRLQNIKTANPRFVLFAQNMESFGNRQMHICMGMGVMNVDEKRLLNLLKKAQKSLSIMQKKFMGTNMIIVKFITKELIEKYVLFVQNMESFGSHHQVIHREMVATNVNKLKEKQKSKCI